MLVPSGIDDVSRTKIVLNIRERTAVISTFLKEYGEYATWDEWLYFLHEREVKGFEWTQTVN